MLTVKLNCFNWGGRLPSLAVSSLGKPGCPKPTVFKGVNQRNLVGAFLFKVQPSPNKASALSVEVIKRTILTGIEYLTRRTHVCYPSFRYGCICYKVFIS